MLLEELVRSFHSSYKTLDNRNLKYLFRSASIRIGFESTFTFWLEFFNKQTHHSLWNSKLKSDPKQVRYGSFGYLDKSS